MSPTPLELFADGLLQDAIRVQRDHLASHPRDEAARMLLAELLLFNGQLADARQHVLQFSRELPEAADYVVAYLALLDAEAKRQAFHRGDPPLARGAPSKHLWLRLAALKAIRGKNHEEVQDLLDEADEVVPPIAGHVDGREFDAIRDTDELYGPVLEALVEGEWVWLPLEHLRVIRLEPRGCPRDLYFQPATIRAKDGDTFAAHLPGLYPGSFESTDDDLRVGQATDWTDDGGWVRGLGQRVFAIGDEELALQEIKQIEIR